MVKIIFKIDGEDRVVEAAIGDTLLVVAQKNGVKLFGGCDGAGVCGTCYVFIDPNYISKLSAPSFNEQDLLDIIPNGKTNSRLACQLIISEELDGMTVTIP